MQTVYLIIASLLLLPGIIGIILPAIPGIPYMLFITLIYAVITKFNTLNTTEIIILLSITLISVLVDYSSGMLGAKYGGANKKSILVGFVFFVVGSVILPPFGGIIGLVLGVLVYEILIHSDHQKALKAATGSLIGTLAGILLNLILGISFIVLFLIFSLNK